jgi:hypothetical protein
LGAIGSLAAIVVVAAGRRFGRSTRFPGLPRSLLGQDLLRVAAKPEAPALLVGERMQANQVAIAEDFAGSISEQQDSLGAVDPALGH